MSSVTETPQTPTANSPSAGSLTDPESSNAAAPFDHEKADIILRSSDNVDFRVLKIFLSFASPFFEGLFDIPQPAEASKDQEFKDGLAVIPFAEDSKTLDVLLRFCYPSTLAEDPDLDDLEVVTSALEAVGKYSLDSIKPKVCRMLSDPEILEAEPLRCFAIARRWRLENETLLAAKYTLAGPLIPSMFKDMELITTADLLALLAYHQDCGSVVYALKSDISWIKSHYETSQIREWLSGKYVRVSNADRGTFVYRDCRCQRSSSPNFLLFEPSSLQWWEKFMERTFTALQNKPCMATVERFAAKTVHEVKALNCPACSINVEEGMRDFSNLLETKMDEVISQVILDFTLPEDVLPGPRGKKRKRSTGR